jgi:hypothetical protein
MDNTSLLTADRTTHLKIVVLALLGATLVAGIGVASRITESGLIGADGRFEATAPVMKPSKPITASTSEQTTVR